MTGMCQHAQFFVEMDSHLLVAWVGLKSSSSYPPLPEQLGYRHEPPNLASNFVNLNILPLSFG
jgi:hypothetical protein